MIVKESKEKTFATAISKFVMREAEQDSDGVAHWDSVRSSLLNDFGSRIGLNLSARDWCQAIYEGSNKTRFECCMNSKNSLTYIRALQGTEFVFHRGCSINMRSIVGTGLSTGGRDGTGFQDASISLALNVSTFGLCAMWSRALRGLSRKKSLALTSSRQKRTWPCPNAHRVNNVGPPGSRNLLSMSFATVTMSNLWTLRRDA